MKRTLLFAAAATFLLACGVTTEERSERRHLISREWPASGVTSIDLRGTNGKVTVRAGDPEKVSMVATVKLRRSGEPGEAERVVKSELESGTLYISEKRSRRRRVFLPFNVSDQHGVSYTLTVPPRMDLDLTNVNGSMDISGVGGKSALRSVNGSIEVAMPGGELTARTVNGRVRANFERDFQGARIKTVNGSIAVSLPPDASFDCDISQVNGSFKSNVPLNVRSGRRGEDIQESVNGGKYPLELSTVNGSVSVRQDLGGTS